MRSLPTTLLILVTLMSCRSALAQSGFSFTLNSINPTANQITPPAHPPDPSQAPVEIVAIEGTPGTDYTMVFDVSEQPAVVFGLGCVINTYTYDSMAGQLTLQIKQLEFIDKGANFEDPNKEFFTISAFKAAPMNSNQGPGPEARGTYFSTNLNPRDFEIFPPMPDFPGFGFRLSGPKGRLGLFKMFIPQTVINLIGQAAGKTLSATDLAIFNVTNRRNNQASDAVTELNGGALISIGVDFTSGSTKIKEDFQPPETFDGTNRPTIVTKKLVLLEKQDLSFAPENFTVSGNRLKVYGFVKDSALIGTRLKIQQKVGRKFQNAATALVQNDGSYSRNIGKANLKTSSFIGIRATRSRKATLRVRSRTGLVSSAAQVTISR